MSLNVGDKIKDNDPRMTGRVLTVVAIDTGRVTVKRVVGQFTSRDIRIAVERIFTDGKTRRYGFNKIMESAYAK